MAFLSNISTLPGQVPFWAEPLSTLPATASVGQLVSYTLDGVQEIVSLELRLPTIEISLEEIEQIQALSTFYLVDFPSFNQPKAYLSLLLVFCQSYNLHGCHILLHQLTSTSKGRAFYQSLLEDFRSSLQAEELVLTSSALVAFATLAANINPVDTQPPERADLSDIQSVLDETSAPKPPLSTLGPLNALLSSLCCVAGGLHIAYKKHCLLIGPLLSDHRVLHLSESEDAIIISYWKARILSQSHLDAKNAHHVEGFD